MAATSFLLTANYQLKTHTAFSLASRYAMTVYGYGYCRGSYALEYELYQLPTKRISSVRYLVKLSREGYPTMTVAAQSIQIRVKKNSENEVLNTCTASFPALGENALIDYIKAYATLTAIMEMTYSDGAIESYELTAVDFNSAQFNVGQNNSTISITGRRYKPVADYQVYIPTGVRTFGGDYVERYRMRCTPQFGLSAGMAVKYNGQHYIAEELIYNIGTVNADMDINMVRQ